MERGGEERTNKWSRRSVTAGDWPKLFSSVSTKPRTEKVAARGPSWSVYPSACWPEAARFSPSFPFIDTHTHSLGFMECNGQAPHTQTHSSVLRASTYTHSHCYINRKPNNRLSLSNIPNTICLFQVVDCASYGALKGEHHWISEFNLPVDCYDDINILLLIWYYVVCSGIFFTALA